MCNVLLGEASVFVRAVLAVFGGFLQLLAIAGFSILESQPTQCVYSEKGVVGTWKKEQRGSLE